MTRPYRRSTVQELRAYLKGCTTSAGLLTTIREELLHRSTAAARELLAEVEAAIAKSCPQPPAMRHPHAPNAEGSLGLPVEGAESPFDPLSPDSPQARAAEPKIKQLREQLLDLSTRNRLISFKHTPNSSRYVRIVDESLPHLFAQIIAGASVEFVPVPDPPDEPEDENTDEFRAAFNRALLTDKSYLKEAKEIGASAGDDAEARLRKVERALRDRVRRHLRLPTRFQAMPSLRDYAVQLGINPEFDLSGSRLGYRRRGENQWQTLMGPQDLARRLSALEHAAREAQQELGVETLHLVFGFLEWYPRTPDGEAEEMLLSPLVLQLATIEKRRKLGPRTVGGRRLLEPEAGVNPNRSHEWHVIMGADAEEPTVNLTLRARLKEDWGLLLPDLDPEAPDIELFFEEVKRAIQTYPRWRLRNYVTLTHLSFSRLAMYQDLDPENPELLPPHLHPLLGELFGGRTPEPDEAEDPPAGPTPRDPVPVLVLDADSSQYAAIAAVLSGRNLVVQGPPGTGKSQTIANTIAAAMYLGKTVLFVAEKLVALQVVQKRLAEAGLGDFILELHSAKAGKKPVIESIRKRIDLSRPPGRRAEREVTRARHRNSADALDAYAAAMNAPFGKLGYTLHDIIWRYLADVDHPLPDPLRNFELADAELWTGHDSSSRRASVVKWAHLRARSVAEAASEDGTHPWSWITNEDADVADQKRIIDCSRQLAASLGELALFLEATRLSDSRRLSDLIQLELRLRDLGPRPPGIRPAIWDIAAATGGDCVVNAVLESHRILENGLSIVRDIAPALLLEDDPAPGLDDLDQSLASLAPWRESDSGESLRLRLNTTQSMLDFLPKAADLLGSVASLVGSQIEDPGSIAAVATLIELAAETPPCSVGRTMNWQGDQAVSVVLDAIAKVESLRQLRDQVRSLTRFEFDTLSAAAVDAAIAELTHSSWFSWPFNLQFRIACRLAKAVALDQDRDHRLMILRKISDALRGSSVLNSHPAQAIAGPLFTGATSNLDVLRAVCEWVERVRGATPIIPQINLRMRSLLLSFGNDLHSLARSLVVDQWPQRLREVSRVCEVAKISFSALPEFLRREQNTIELVLSLVTESQWSGLISRERIKTVAATLEEIRLTRATLAEHRETAALFLPNIAASSRELELAHAAINRVAAVGLQDEWRQRLSAGNGAPDWDTLSDYAARFRGYLERVQSALGTLAPLAAPAGSLECDWLAQTLDDVSSRLRAALPAEFALATHCESLANLAILRASGLLSFVAAVDSPPEPPDLLGNLLDRLLISSLCHSAFRKVPALRPFRHSSPGELREQFRQYDEEMKHLDRCVLVSHLLERRAPKGNAVGRVSERTEMALLEYVCGLQSPRTPVRDLIRRSSKALQAIKPCFMMSPLSVAQLVSRGDVGFDLVVFDEASQIRPEDALCALARARQFVVVGDQHQLPPTSFWVKSVDEPEPEEEEEDETPVVDSILELSAAAYGQGPMLTWHYRSRDPALIAYSHHEFYDEKLRLFPAPRDRSPTTGVHFVHVEGIYSARTNLIEAQECARAAIEFMHLCPQRSLGIVALNRPQADLIELELDRLIGEDPRALEYCTQWDNSIEPFFVKNLESVQGDERDVIFISTVFARDEAGRFFQRFGPINSPGGHRRLNVLFTRAKYQLVVFSSLPFEEIKLDERSHPGVRVLKEYLQYARSGLLPLNWTPGRPTESPFEDAVIGALKGEGFQCEPQVGVAGFWIDLAVRSPHEPDHFIIGIECDGAAYHSSRAARDRDRLRQQILESLGWTIYRVWSTDWFANPRHELRKLVSAVREQIHKNPLGPSEPTLPFLRKDRRSEDQFDDSEGDGHTK
jgi:very-short-patch-repair endonuclease